jgi:hypothetical protein
MAVYGEILMAAVTWAQTPPVPAPASEKSLWLAALKAGHRMVAEKDAIYVAGRVSEVPFPPAPSERMHCAQCNAQVWVEQGRLGLARGCRILCVTCAFGPPSPSGGPPV